MEVNEFINRIITLGFDKKTIDFHVAKWNRSFLDGSEIQQNALILQWYTTQIFISTRILSHKLPLAKISTFYLQYDASLRASEFIQKENEETQGVVLLKMGKHRVEYNYVYKVNDTYEVLEPTLIQEIGKCFARLCGQADSIDVRKLGSDLFSNSMRLCINDFKSEKIEFSQENDLPDDH